MHKKLGRLDLWWAWGHEVFGTARYYGAALKLGRINISAGVSDGDFLYTGPLKTIQTYEVHYDGREPKAGV